MRCCCNFGGIFATTCMGQGRECWLHHRFSCVPFEVAGALTGIVARTKRVVLAVVATERLAKTGVNQTLLEGAYWVFPLYLAASGCSVTGFCSLEGLRPTIPSTHHQQHLLGASCWHDSAAVAAT